MPIDASIYQNLKPVEMPSILDAQTKAMGLRHLAMQNEEAETKLGDQRSLRDAFTKHTGTDGKINEEGLLADLGRSSPQNRFAVQKQLGDLRESEAKAQAAKAEAMQKRAGQFALGMKFMAEVPDKDKPLAWENLIKQYKAQGIITPDQGIPDQYDPIAFRGFNMKALEFLGQNSEEYLKTQGSVADLRKKDQDFERGQLEIPKTKAEIRKLQVEAEKLAREGKNPAKSLSPGEQKADEAFGKEIADYYYGGGKAIVEKNLQSLQGAITKLGSSPNLTGGWTTRIPGVGSDFAQDSINPEMSAVRDDIRGAIQGTLKQVLGGQYTEKEGEAIFNRAFNPRLSSAENIKRATAELNALQRMAAEKDKSMERFIASGTLKGYQPGGTAIAGDNRTPPKQPGGMGLDGVPSANADSKAPAYGVGDLVQFNGKHYTVGPDGQELIPVKGKK